MVWECCICPMPTVGYLSCPVSLVAVSVVTWQTPRVVLDQLIGFFLSIAAPHVSETGMCWPQYMQREVCRHNFILVKSVVLTAPIKRDKPNC